MKPTGERHRLANGRRIARQHQKRRLKSVLGICFPAQDASANLQHQIAMTTHQHGERGFIPPFDEAMHQVGVRQMRGALGQEHALKMPENRVWLAARHEIARRVKMTAFLYIVAGRSFFSSIFREKAWALIDDLMQAGDRHDSLDLIAEKDVSNRPERVVVR